MDDLIIIGGGLAGLTAAIDVARSGFGVTVIESKQYPQHKVCGEYVSNEILPYFDRLAIPVREWQPRQVQRFRLHAPSGRWVESRLPLGGFGLRRFTLDERLYQLARDRGVRFALKTTVKDIAFSEDRFEVRASDGREWEAKTVVGSFGKRSGLDRRLDRSFAKEPADYIGVKFYVETDFPEDLVALYNFDGGYAGAVRVEDGTVDVAYLTRSRQLRANGGLEELEETVLYRSPPLRDLLTTTRRADVRPLTISNISFSPKEQVRNHVLMVGDAAGMIPPLCGNGMAMGVHAAKLASESVVAYLSGRETREGMERGFHRRWQRQFARRLFWGRRLHSFMGQPLGSELAVGALRLMPGVLPALIRRTHGAAFA
jgi:flavin-dependent dehydrogenase